MFRGYNPGMDLICPNELLRHKRHFIEGDGLPECADLIIRQIYFGLENEFYKVIT